MHYSKRVYVCSSYFSRRLQSSVTQTTLLGHPDDYSHHFTCDSSIPARSSTSVNGSQWKIFFSCAAQTNWSRISLNIRLRSSTAGWKLGLPFIQCCHLATTGASASVWLLTLLVSQNVLLLLCARSLWTAWPAAVALCFHVVRHVGESIPGANMDSPTDGEFISVQKWNSL